MGIINSGINILQRYIQLINQVTMYTLQKK